MMTYLKIHSTNIYSESSIYQIKAENKTIEDRTTADLRTNSETCSMKKK